MFASSSHDAPEPPSHQPQSAYTTGLPAPPRILIPPPSINPHDSITAPEWQQPSLSHMVLQSESVLPGSLSDWKYEYRREAQQLLPHLYLGPLSATKNVAFLQRENVTLLLAVRSTMTARARLLGAQGIAGVEYMSIDVSQGGQLISQFQRAAEIIDNHYLKDLPEGFSDAPLNVPIDGCQLRSLQENWMRRNHVAAPPGGKTLLFCESGNERSAVVAAAYIMQHLGGSTIQAIQMVQGKRFCVCFDDTMKWMLSSYEPIWKARQQFRIQSGQTGRKSKRRMEEEEEEEEGLGGGRAPFMDEEGGYDVEMIV